jgi:1-deoxy-D-xylulose-5-phosphate reductoisomerase
VHGLVSFIDGSVTAGLAAPDMRVPIAHGLGLPGRMPVASRRLDLAALGTLTFERPDFDRFAGLKWAMDAMRAGGSAPLIYNAANEAAVSAFLKGNMPFGAIARVIGETLARYGQGRAPGSVEEALAIDHDVKKLAETLLPDVIKAAT